MRKGEKERERRGREGDNEEGRGREGEREGRRETVVWKVKEILTKTALATRYHYVFTLIEESIVQVASCYGVHQVWL